MIRLVLRNLCLAVLFLSICSMLGCATPERGRRYYSGPPLPSNEVALVYDVGIYIWGIRNEREKEEKQIFAFRAAPRELLPGQYIMKVRYFSISGNKRSDDVFLKLDALAGNIYIIYPEITNSINSTGETFRPIFVNIKDYNEEECREKSSWSRSGNCPDKNRINEDAIKYLQGERRILSYQPANPEHPCCWE